MLPVVAAPLTFDGIITFSPDDFDTWATVVALILVAGGLGWMLRGRRSKRTRRTNGRQVPQATLGWRHPRAQRAIHRIVGVA